MLHFVSAYKHTCSRLLHSLLPAYERSHNVLQQHIVIVQSKDNKCLNYNFAYFIIYELTNKPYDSYQIITGLI